MNSSQGALHRCTQKIYHDSTFMISPESQRGEDHFHMSTFILFAESLSIAIIQIKQLRNFAEVD